MDWLSHAEEKQCGGMEAIWTELESYLHPLPHFISVGSYLTFSGTVSLCKAATEPGSLQMPKKSPNCYLWPLEITV